MATEDFFAALDEAEAKVEVEEKAQAPKVRYWYEEGYVPGNERDSDEESTVNNESEACEDAKARSEQAASTEGDEGEECAQPPKDRGGRFVRWGGLGGRRCLADRPENQVPALEEILEELMLPEVDTLQVFGASSSSGAPPPPPDREDGSRAAQASGGSFSAWSHRAVVASLPAGAMPTIHESDIRQRYTREDRGTGGPEARSMEEASAQQQQQQHKGGLGGSGGAAQLRHSADMPFAESSRFSGGGASSSCSREPLPGTRRPKVLSQAWQRQQEDQAGALLGGTGARPAARAGRSGFAAFASRSGGAAQAAASASAAPGEQASCERGFAKGEAVSRPRPGTGAFSMLPGSLAAASSSSSLVSRPRPLQVVGCPPLKLRSTREGEVLVVTGPLAAVEEPAAGEEEAEAAATLAATSDVFSLDPGALPWAPKGWTASP